jgi:hypothetical protein
LRSTDFVRDTGPSHAAVGCPEPVRRPVMVQRWVDVVFLHWPYRADDVQRLLPSGVTVDTFEGMAWVGLVPFSMEGLGLPGLAPLPLVGSFPEVNVRTYVQAGGRRGVWFFSLDVDRAVPVAVARSTYHLPYCLARADHVRVGDIVTSRVERRWPRRPGGATTRVAVQTGRPVDPADSFAAFLTARWGLLSASRRGRLWYAPVDHPVWPLHDAHVLHVDDHLVSAAGLPTPSGPPHALWAPGVDVRVGRPTRIPRGH